MKKLNRILLLFVVVLLGNACDFLDIIPDNVVTVDSAFEDRIGAEKFLFTCYSYLPYSDNIFENPSLLGGDETWIYDNYRVNLGTDVYSVDIARGLQNVQSPLLNYWDGINGGNSLFIAIRDCNIFLDNIDKVNSGLEELSKKRMIAEVKVLKAYYNFYLMRMYGPIPIVKENLPISSTTEQVNVYREPFDDGISYICELIDEAANDLPNAIMNEADELGRLTKPAALALKAKVLVMAASPLFNGNTDFSGLVDNRGINLFSSGYDELKWKEAADACKEAIDEAISVGHKLYTFNGIRQISDSTHNKLTIRGSVNDRWNSELIWGNFKVYTGAYFGIQKLCFPRVDITTWENLNIQNAMAPSLRIAEQFYSKNGVPIEEDISWDYNKRYELRKAESDHKYYIREGYTTANLHFDRELRFYADLGFDGSLFYGNSKYDDTDTWTIEAKKGQVSSQQGIKAFSATGYWDKKLINYETVAGSGQSFTSNRYAFPIIRLADLYLMYAEALNESKSAPDAEVYEYIDEVRNRAKLPGVVESWQQHSTQPSKPTTKDGMREIIHQERLIELCFEGSRFWDLRRWKKAIDYNNGFIYGWTIDREKAEEYYIPAVLFKQEFATKDYLWPIRQSNLTVNGNLVQNPGW